MTQITTYVNHIKNNSRVHHHRLASMAPKWTLCTTTYTCRISMTAQFHLSNHSVFARWAPLEKTRNNCCNLRRHHHEHSGKFYAVTLVTMVRWDMYDSCSDTLLGYKFIVMQKLPHFHLSGSERSEKESSSLICLKGESKGHVRTTHRIFGKSITLFVSSKAMYMSYG